MNDHARDEQLVAEAARRATRMLRRGDRWARAITFFAVGLAIGALAGGLTAYWVAHENAATVRHDAKVSAHRESLNACESQAKARPQGNARAFDLLVFADVLRVATQLKPPKTAAERAQTAAFFDHLNGLLDGKAKEAPKGGWASYAPGVLPHKFTSFVELENTIQPVPLLNCEHVLKR